MQKENIAVLTGDRQKMVKTGKTNCSSSPSPSANQLHKSNRFNTLQRVPNLALGTHAGYRPHIAVKYSMVWDHNESGVPSFR